MNKIVETYFNAGTYGLTFAGIAVNFENIKSLILFFGALILLGLQIYLHIIKIKKEKNGSK